MNQHSAIFAHSGLAVTAVSPEASDIEWLRESLEPAFSTSEAGTASIEVRVVIDPVRYRSLCAQTAKTELRSMSCFTFDSEAGDYPVLELGNKVVQDEELRCFYSLDEDNLVIEIIAAARIPALRIALLRILRELVTQHLDPRRCLQMHGAALSCCDYGLVICGPKGAGKSSLLIHLLRTSSTGYISNDRSLLHITADGVTVTGMPTIVSIREGTLSLLSGMPLARYTHWLARLTLGETLAQVPEAAGHQRPPRLVVNPAQFCHIIEAKPVPRAPLHALLFPRVDLSAHGLKVNRLSASDVLLHLQNNVMISSNSVFRSMGFGTAPPGRATTVITEIASRYPGFECVLGKDAFAAPLTTADLVQLFDD